MQQLGAGVKRYWNNPRSRAVVDFMETNRGEVREETVVGNACGRKSDSPGSKAILLSHEYRVEPSP